MENFYARVLMERLVHSQKRREISNCGNLETREGKDVWDYRGNEFCAWLKTVFQIS